LIERGDDVTLGGLGSRPTTPAILTAREWDAVAWRTLDVGDACDVVAAIDASRPELVVHLAGVSFVPRASSAPAAAFEVNVVGAVRLLAELAERRRAGALDPVVLVIGSGMQYGKHAAAEIPLVESAEQRPTTVYAATKAAQEVAALQAHRASGLRVVCTRSFNHSGPGHDPNFLLPALVQRVRDIARTGARALALGNDSVRDYLHVADVVNAYLLLAERGSPGEVYNVCSGSGVGVRQLAAEVLRRAGVTAEITTDPALVREDDVPVLIGSPARLTQATGWTQQRSRDELIDDLLNAQAN
jgi:GDP-4-dehydro-6-deoxy-D-mannose reductase